MVLHNSLVSYTIASLNDSGLFLAWNMNEFEFGAHHEWA